MITSATATHTATTDILIVGGGPTGLTLAIVLSRYGIKCRIIDRDVEDHVHSRGKGVQPRTLEVFDDLGIADKLRAIGTSSGSVRFYTNKEPVAEVRLPEVPPRPGIPYPGLLIVPQFQTERILRERLQDFGVMIERSRQLVSFRDTGDGVVATVKDTATDETEDIAAAYLVGCDGGRSTVRQQLGLRFDGENHDQYWVLGDMDITGLGTHVEGHAWFADDNSYLSASKLPGMHGWQVQASVQPNAAGEVEPASLHLFQQLFAERTGFSDVRVSNATWLSNYNVKRRVVDHYRRGRVFVAGDAAHIHSPAGGQGLNTGVQDAYNLGWKLAQVLQGKASSALLDTYEEERLPIAQGVLSKSETGNSLFFSANPFIAFFRRFVFLPLLRQPRVTAALLLKTAQLDLNYRGASLARNDEAHARGLLHRWATRGMPQAGDRAPDARLHDARTGTPTRIFDILRGPHWTLLVFAGRAEGAPTDKRLQDIMERITGTYSDAVRSHLILRSPHAAAAQHDAESSVSIDTGGEGHTLYRAPAGTLVLIRPDGYIAFRGNAATDTLFSFLDDVFRPMLSRPIEIGGAGLRFRSDNLHCLLLIWLVNIMRTAAIPLWYCPRRYNG